MNFGREWEIFCCWLNGHTLSKRDQRTKFTSCRCGVRRLSDEQRAYRTNWHRPRIYTQTLTDDQIRANLMIPEKNLGATDAQERSNAWWPPRWLNWRKN